MKTCFLFGHRDAPEALLPAIEAAMLECVDARGVEEFVVGRYGGFDALAARAGCAVKRKRPGVVLTLLLPYLPAAPEALPPGFDGSLFPDGLERAPRRFAISRANRWMLGRCDCAVAYAVHPGNAAELLRRAEGRKIHIVRLADPRHPLYNREPAR